MAEKTIVISSGFYNFISSGKMLVEEMGHGFFIKRPLWKILPPKIGSSHSSIELLMNMSRFSMEK